MHARVLSVTHESRNSKASQISSVLNRIHQYVDLPQSRYQTALPATPS